MSNDTLIQQIKEELPDIASNDSLIAECVAVCKNYALSAEDLRYKHEALHWKPSGTRSEIATFTLDTLGTLKAHIQRERATSSIAKTQQQHPRSSLVTLGRGAFRRNPPPRPAAAIAVKFEPTDGMEGIAGPSTVAFRGPSMSDAARKKRAYRYMHEKPSERGNALDSRIEEFAERIREHYDITDISNPSSSTSDDVTVVGRIIQDDDAAEDSAKLAEGAIALEASRSLGDGSRVPLRFDGAALKIRGAPQGSEKSVFFPGAIAALRGKNGGGGYFQVSEILTLPPLLPTPLDVKPDPLEHAHDSAFSVFIASGPYTSDQDLNFKQYTALLEKITAARPAVVILLGPFVDALHPSIKSGDIDITAQRLFHVRILDPLKRYLDGVPGSMALVISSVRDLLSDHAVFPQCELPSAVAGGDPRIHLLPNPTTFSLNGITFGATSADVLFHLKKGEFALSRRGPEGEVDPTPAMPDDLVNDAMTNLCRHLLQQRSFYPVFPVPLEGAAEVILDVTHSDGLRLGSSVVDDEAGEGAPEKAPDVLILPSRFKQFTKTVYATKALNPSFVYKGSYIVLDVAARSPGAESSKARLSARVAKIE